MLLGTQLWKVQSGFFGATVAMSKYLLLNAFICWHKVLAVVLLYFILCYSCLGSALFHQNRHTLHITKCIFFKSDLFIDFSEKIGLDDVFFTLLPQALNASPAQLIPHL